jgi:transposase InsO family protein
MTRKRRRHTPDQIIRKLAEGHKQLAAGTSLEEVCRHLEARVIIEDWRIDYNEHRPHTAHGDLTPTEFARAWTTKLPEAA